MKMRYVILFRSGPQGEFTRLVPGEHLGIYDKPEVNAAIDHMVASAHVCGMALQLGIEQFNIMRVPNGTVELTAFER